MKPIFVSFLLSFVFTFVLSAHPDSTIYENELEKQVFQQVSDSIPATALDLFLSINYDPREYSEISDRIDLFMRQLDLKMKNQKKIKRQLKTVYKSVHDAFFSKYEEHVYFSDIFQSGNYNCVSATALYAMILDKLGINYMIQETPTHVYLVADTTDTRFLFESTRPADGLVQFSAKYQKDFIDYLHKNKIISDSEYRDEPLITLFRSYYSRDVSIDLRQLAGIQYYNDGVFLYSEEKYEEAMKSFVKAHELYPSNTIRYMLNLTLSVVLDRELNTETQDPLNLLRYFKLNHADENAMQNGVNYFQNVSVKMLVENARFDAYNSYFRDLRADEIDPEYGTQIKEIYHSLVGYYHYSNYNYRSALDHLEIAYAMNTKDLETKEMVRDLTTRYLVSLEDYQMMLDSLNHFCEVFPFLASDNQTGSLKVGILCYLVSSSYMDREFRKGMQYIQQLEYYIRDHPDVPVEENNIVAAFSQASASYVQDQQYKMAEEMLSRGLKLAPNSLEMRKRLSSLREFTSTFGPGRSGSEKIYREALNKARRSGTEITKRFYKHGMKKWTTFKVIDGANMIDVQPGQEFDFELKLNRRAKIELFGMRFNGRWVYNEDNCTLTIYMDDQKGRVSILISEIDPSRISGIFFMDGNHSNAYRIFLKGD